MTLEEKVSVLKKNLIFDNLPESEYFAVGQKTEIVSYKKGDVIFEEKTNADAFYIIAQGEVEILKKSDDGILETLAVKKEYDSFGEMSMIDDLPRSATIRAKTDLKLLMINKDDFLELMRSLSKLSYSIAKNVCHTVRTTNETYIRDLENRNKELEIAYNKLKETQNELIKAEKLSVIGSFASLIIHDIKNPLTNIRAYAELISLTNKDENKKIERATGIIIKEVDRLSDMTSELLEFARGDIKLSKTPVNLYSYISTLIDTVYQDLKNRNIVLSLEKDDTDILIEIDTTKMNRVFFNIIGNACDAMENGGEIKIFIGKKDNELLWSIKDTGCGMSEEVLKRIFEPFYTKKAKGTGLGMAIVKNIITSHEGRIELFSKINEGTKFDIYLPLQ